MIGIVIVAHGRLGHEMLASLEHVVGKLEAATAISIDPDYNRSAKQAEICAAADLVDHGDGVVVVTDIFGGSPSNLCMRACSRIDRKILYGANLPLLVKLAKTRDKPIAEAVQAAKDAGRKYINSFDGVPG
jgi:PTS system mannose-specific IIA component